MFDKKIKLYPNKFMFYAPYLIKGEAIMKKHFITLTLLIFLSFFLIGCSQLSNSVRLTDKKDKIVEKKYGELEYIIKNINVYKNLKEEFDYLEEVDYIVNNSGDRGSVNPSFAENYYVTMDIVKHEDEYKLLIYNSIMKRGADKTKMFVLTNYFLPIKIETVLSHLEENEIEQDIKKFHVSFIKKDKNTEYDFNNDSLSLAYYNKIEEETIYISFYDYFSGVNIIGTTFDYYVGNTKEKIIYYPKNKDYQNIIKEVYNTLNDEKIEFSLNKGEDFKTIDDKLIDFDIWDEQINNEVFGSVFFYAFTYEEFLIKIEEAKEQKEEYYVEGINYEGIKDIFNEEYFEENILIFYSKYESNISENYAYSVTKKDDTLTLNINRIEGMETAIISWTQIITIKKTDIKGVNKINLIVRTISEPTKKITAYVSEDYLRDFYLNPKTIDDFKDLNNLKDIQVFHWSLFVDLKFNKTITDDDLLDVINYLEDNPYAVSEGYRGKDFIRLKMDFSLYDKVINKTLLIEDFIDQEFIDDYSLSINILNFIPIGSITFTLDKPGRENAFKMIRDLCKGDYPFLEPIELYYNY